jgi:tight adherence protein C
MLIETARLVVSACAAAAIFFAAVAALAFLRGSAAASRGFAGGIRAAVLGPIAAHQRTAFPPGIRDRIRAALRRAGDPAGLTVEELAALVELSAAGCLAAAAVLAIRLHASALFVPAGALFGALLPALWLRDLARARQAAIVRALPYDVDLLTLCVEAGLDFVAALSKVVERGRKGPLAGELSIALKELRLGKTREEALRGLAARVEVPAMTSLVQALLHADRMGTPLGNVLRMLSSQLRIERTQRTEKLANEAPVKLLLPLLVFIFPTLFLMLFGPLAYQVLFGGDV